MRGSPSVYDKQIVTKTKSLSIITKLHKTGIKNDVNGQSSSDKDPFKFKTNKLIGHDWWLIEVGSNVNTILSTFNITI